MTAFEHAISALGLVLPEQLKLLIAIGIWPNAETAQRQINRPIVSPACVKAFAPNENGLYLYAPQSFRSVAQDLRAGNGLTAEQQAANDIDPERTIIVGDFGLGSDAAIALDYRHDAHEPSVIRLVWADNGAPNRWVQIAPTFDDFWTMIRLRSRANDR